MDRFRKQELFRRHAPLLGLVLIAISLVACNHLNTVVNSLSGPTVPPPGIEWKIDPSNGECYGIDNQANIYKPSASDRYKPKVIKGNGSKGCGCPEMGPDGLSNVLGDDGVAICEYGPDRMLIP